LGLLRQDSRQVRNGRKIAENWSPRELREVRAVGVVRGCVRGWFRGCSVSSPVFPFQKNCMIFMRDPSMCGRRVVRRTNVNRTPPLDN
jgi:hypothetical protein